MFRRNTLQLTKQDSLWKSLYLCSVTPLSDSLCTKKDFNLQEEWCGNFLSLSSIFIRYIYFYMHLRVPRRVLDSFSVNEEWKKYTPSFCVARAAQEAVITGHICMPASYYGRSTWRPSEPVSRREFDHKLVPWKTELSVYWLAIVHCLIYSACIELTNFSTDLCLSESVSWTRVRKLQPASWLPIVINNV